MERIDPIETAMIKMEIEGLAPVLVVSLEGQAYELGLSNSGALQVLGSKVAVTDLLSDPDIRFSEGFDHGGDEDARVQAVLSQVWLGHPSKKELEGYQDELLDDAEAEKVRAHIMWCNSCANQLLA